jgi:ribokinase
MTVESHILVVGSLNLDLVVICHRIPKPGETLFGSTFNVYPGGKGANQAVAAARLGSKTHMIGRIGGDEAGIVLLEGLDAAGVDRRGVATDKDGSTGRAVIVVDETGQDAIVVVPGSNMSVSPGDIEGMALLYRKASAVLMQLEIPIESVVRSSEIARDFGARTILNAAPAQLIPESLFPLIDVLVVNETEATALTGVEVGTTAEARISGRRLVDRGARVAVITLGAAGAFLCTPDLQASVPAFPVSVVDATGAGDAFMAGLAVALAERRSVLEAVRWGNAAGALACSAAGAQPSFPWRKDVETLLGGGVAPMLP